ncbi:MAG: tetratricopeptide repeat protein [Gaiellaceae bacterium]
MTASRPRLYISLDTQLDWLTAIEFGRVDEGQPPGAWDGIDNRVGFLSASDGSPVGFAVRDWSTFDPEAQAFERLWAPEPRFHAPQLGLFDATPGEICLAVRAWLPDEPTLNRAYFHMAIGAAHDLGDEEEAARLWRLCLEAGDAMAHYGLGYTLYSLGDHQGAYRHLRTYTELAPWQEWAWCWLGKACIALDQRAEAEGALRRAIELEEDGEPTDAPELLAELERSARR